MKLTLVVAMFLDLLTSRNERRTLGRVEYQQSSQRVVDNKKALRQSAGRRGGHRFPKTAFFRGLSKLPRGRGYFTRWDQKGHCMHPYHASNTTWAQASCTTLSR
uniref:Putative secreted protein n=1 Tax=Ixodes ricinus TaxID=34613 RepID=A0A147BMH5_IXORI